MDAIGYMIVAAGGMIVGALGRPFVDLLIEAIKAFIAKLRGK